MGIKKDYLNAAVDTIMKMNSSLNRDDVVSIVSSMIKENMKDPTIYMDNNVTGDNMKTTLTGLCNWIEKRDPVISGNATFYMQPTEMLSPTSNMLRSLKKGRKEVKKEMFNHKPDSDEYKRLDLDQLNKKIIMNAEYGGSGAPTAAFYTKYSPPATTLMAQSIITTMAAFFESYVGNNQKFFSINECYDWMNKVIQKDKKIPKWVIKPSAEEVYSRLIKHFVTLDIDSIDKLKMYIHNCSEKELVYLYYANNLNVFIYNHPKIHTLLSNILSTLPLYEAAVKDSDIPMEFIGKFDSANKYNKWISKEMFLDPYDTPKCIKSYMDELIDLLNQFIYVEYITPDSIVKLNNHRRNTVLLVDTDSNIINADLFVSFVLDTIVPGENFSRSRLYNEMILVNVLASCLDSCVVNMLDYYGRTHHMDKESRAELTMKNEFMFRRFFLMNKKKRYAASIVLREGNINIPFKLEIKGVDFIKAGSSIEVTERFTKMLEDHILFSDNLELHELMRDLKSFEREIYHDLSNGGTKYLKLQMYKAAEAYKKVKDKNTGNMVSRAWSLPVYRGAAVWNELYPDRKIYSLDRVNILKLIVTNENDLEIIKRDYPSDYDMVMKKIFRSSNPDIQKAGLKVLAIPTTVNVMPKWLIPLIDYDVIISDVISSFRSVLEALQIEEIYSKTPNGNANINSCLISL